MRDSSQAVGMGRFFDNISDMQKPRLLDDQKRRFFSNQEKNPEGLLQDP
jgi:hypothetical protein